MADSIKVRIDGDTKPLEGSLKAIGSVAKKSLGIAVGASAALGGALIGVTEATRESREEMNKLNTAFESNGKTAEDASQAYSVLYGILGETDQSVEAASHLAELTNNQEELGKWTNISAGVLSKFGDSLPLEGLTEAASVTATLGKVTGPLTDAFEFAGIKVDDFDKKLASASSAEERATMVTEELNNIYGETGAVFRETNADIIEARTATDALNTQLARVGGLFEPLLSLGKFNLSGAIQNMIDGFEDGGIAGMANVGLNMVVGFTESMITGFITNLPAITEGVVSMLNNFTSTVTENLPAFVQTGSDMLLNLVNGLIANLPILFEATITMLSTILVSIIEQLPIFVQTGQTILLNIINGILENLPQMIATVVTLISTIINAIVENLPLILQTGVDIILKLIDGITENLPMIIETMITIINTLITTITEKLPEVVQSGIGILMKLIDGIISKLPEIIAAVIRIVSQFIATLVANLPKIISAGMDIVGKLVMGLVQAIPKLVGAIPSIVKAIIDTLMETNWLDVGLNIVKGILSGFLDLGSIVYDAVTALGNSILGNIKSFFGIASPAKKMKPYGRFITQGLGIGVEDATPDLVRSVENQAGAVEKAFRRSLGDMDYSVNSSAMGIIGTSQGEAQRNTTNNKNTEIKQYFNAPTVSPFDAYRKVVGYA